MEQLVFKPNAIEGWLEKKKRSHMNSVIGKWQRRYPFVSSEQRKQECKSKPYMY
jgi:hypothetical protein